MVEKGGLKYVVDKLVEVVEAVLTDEDTELVPPLGCFSRESIVNPKAA